MKVQTLRRDPTSAEVDTEQAVIALFMEGQACAWRVLDTVSREDFLDPLHRRIVDAARRILEAGSTITSVTLGAALSSDPALNQMGGTDYFRKLKAMFPHNADIADDLCAALADNAQRRALASELAQNEALLTDSSISAGEIMAGMSERLQALREGRPDPTDPIGWYEAGKDALEQSEARYAGLGARFVPYGIDAIDREIGGMATTDLIVLAGRPGMGKTAIATWMAFQAGQSGHGVYFSSQEMSAEDLLHRGLSMRARVRDLKIPYNLIRLGKLNQDQHQALAELLVSDAQVPIVIDQRRGLTVSQIAVRVRRAQAKFKREGNPLGLVVIDHLGLIESSGDYRNNRVAEVSQMTRALKNLAGTIGAPVLLLCQINRQVEGRDDKRPYLSDLRESGSIEQDADVVLFAHREEHYLKERPPKESASQLERSKHETALQNAENKLDLSVAKNRHGKKGQFAVKCEIAYNWIGEMP